MPDIPARNLPAAVHGTLQQKVHAEGAWQLHSGQQKTLYTCTAQQKVPCTCTARPAAFSACKASSISLA
jgi:hypothetical protein